MNNSLNKEWYRTKETADILGVSEAVVRNRIYNKKSSLNKIKESEFKKEKGKHLLHRNFILRCQKKEWYTVAEACKMLTKSESWLRKKVNNGEVLQSLYKNNKKLLIHISYINQLLDYFTYVNENYFTYEEASRFLEKEVHCVSAFVNNGTFKDAIQSSSGSYVSKKDVKIYKEMTKNTIVTKDIEEELNISKKQALDLIKNESSIEAYNVGGKQFYIKKKSFQRFKDELVYSVEMASDYLNTTKEIVNMLILKKYVTAFNINGLGLRTSKYYLEEYLTKGDIPIEQLTMEMDTKLSALWKYVYEGEIKTRRHSNDKRHYVTREEAERFKNSLTAIKMKFYNSNKAIEFFNSSIEFFRNNTYLLETLQLFEVWGNKELGKSESKNLKHKATILISLFEYLSKKLNKELFQFTDEELKSLFNSLGKSHVRAIYPFLNYCKRMRNCNFIGDYLWKGQNSKDVELYTKDEWCSFTMVGLDIEKHFEKAVVSKKYAETWLFVLLHFSLAWRQADLMKLKPINIGIVEIDSFGWFDQNTFTLEKAQIILKTVERSLNGERTNKNKKEIVFTIPFIFELPVALAITLCELHRRCLDGGNDILISSSIHTNDLCELFGDELPKFSNRRGNKTIMTYGWETAVKKGKGALAYWLGGFSRSHTQKVDMLNPITQVYLVTSKTDASVEEMALHCFERGIFGWQVKVIIDAINNKEPFSLEEMTRAISEVNKTNSPIMVDSLSKYAVVRHKQSVSLLKELMLVPKKELMKKLKEISKLQSPSLLDYSQCLVGVKNCPFKKEVEYNLECPCLGCKNRIDTNYILDIVNVEIFSLMDRLKNTPISDETTRIKYTHMIRTLTYILMDFKRAFDRYDENYVKSFIDLEKLKVVYQELEQTKFLRISEVNIQNGESTKIGKY